MVVELPPASASDVAAPLRRNAWVTRAFDRLGRRVSGIGRAERLAGLLMLGVGLWTTLVNFRGDYSVHFIDNSWPLNPIASLHALVYSWDPQQLGYLNLLGTTSLPMTAWAAFLQLIGLPSGAQEILTLVLLQATAGWFLFLLFYRFVLARAAVELRAPLAATAALACLTNFGVQTVYWWDFLPYGFEMLAFGAAFLFLLTGRFEEYLNHRPWQPLKIGLLAAAGAIAFSVDVPFNLSLLALTFLLPPVALLAKGVDVRPLRRALQFELLTLLLVGAVSLWWLVPAAQLVQLQPAYAVSQSASINGLAVFISGTSPITFLSVLQGTVGYPIYSAGHFAATVWVTQWLAPVLEILPVVVVFTALVRRRGVLFRPLLLSLAGVLALGLVVTGVNSPLYPTAFNLLFQSSILLTALRTPFVAFGEALAILWVTTIALAFASIYAEVRSRLRQDLAPAEPATGWKRAWPRRIEQWRAVAIATAVIVVLSPMLAAAPGAFAGDAVPVAPYQARLSVAPYETQVAGFLRSDLDGQFGLLFPGGFLEQNWSHGYDAYDVLPSLLPGQFLIDNYREGFVVANNTLLTDAYSVLQSDIPDTANYSALLARLDVRDLVIEGDVGGSFPFGQSVGVNYPRLLGALNHTTNLTLSAVLGPDYVYSVANPRPLVSLAARSVAQSALWSGGIAPDLDLTRAYFNASQLTTPLVPYQWLFPSWNDGIVFDASASLKQAASGAELGDLSSLPSEVTLFNGVPLDIPVAAGDYLALNFTTNAATAISVTLVTTPDLATASPSSLGANSFSVAYPSENLGLGDAALTPTYGANHFTSPGQSAFLIDDLSATLGNSPNRTLDYVLISLWPVLSDGTGIRGLPVGDWPGNQSVSISQIELGRDVYLGPPSLPAAVFAPPAVETSGMVDLSATWASGIGAATPDAPADPLPASETSGGTVLSLNATLRAEWQNASGTAVAQAFGGPTWYNANLLSINITNDPYLLLNVSSARNTGFSAAVVATGNLTGISGSNLGNEAEFLGGSASPNGAGDPLLNPAYGAMHYVTNNSTALFVDDLGETLGSASASIPVNHLFLTECFVLPNGTGARGLGVSEWTGLQSLVVRSVYVAPYLWRGAGPTASPPDLIAARVITALLAGGLSSGTVVADAPAGMYATDTILSFSEVDPTDYQVTISNASGGPILGNVLLTFDQTFHSDWVLQGAAGVSAWVHLTVDSSLNGFLLTPSPGAPRLTMTLHFAAQTTYAASLAIGVLVPPTLAIGVWLIHRSKTRLGWVSRRRG